MLLETYGDLLPIHGTAHWIGGLIDDGDSLLGDSQEPHYVIARALGNRNDVIRAMNCLIDLAIVAGGLRRQELGVEEEGQIMDGDDRTDL